MQTLVQTLVYGLLVGGLYALLGLGMALVFGVMRVVNMAHGEFMMVAMYASFWLLKLLGIDPLVSLLITIPFLFVIGYYIQRFAIQPVLKAPHEIQLLLTFGLGLTLSNVVMILFKSDPRSALVSYSNAAFWLGSISVSVPLLIAFVVAFGLGVGIHLFLTRTDAGRAIRATAQNPGAATLMGIDTRRMGGIAFGLAAGLAGAAGTLLTPIYYITPTVGGLFTGKAFVITVLGGMGSLPGAVLGGLLLGIVESLGQVYVSLAMKDVIGYGVFIAVLALRPSGLMGRTQS